MKTEWLRVPIEEITQQFLLECLNYGFCRYSEYRREDSERFRAMAASSVEQYFGNEDHGFVHSRAVYGRCQELAGLSPQMVSFAKAQNTIGDRQIDDFFRAAAIYHDLMRFFGYGTVDHELPGAELAQAVFSNDDQLVLFELKHALPRHDYFCKIVEGEVLPLCFKKNPLAELFRLGDKTSSSPAAELDRWWKCGQRYNTVFFDETMSDGVRFDFVHNHRQRDQITYFLLLLALQPSDFYAGEAQQAYARWSQGGSACIRGIIELAQRYLTSEQIAGVNGVIERFYQYFDLVSLPNSEYQE